MIDNFKCLTLHEHLYMYFSAVDKTRMPRQVHHVSFSFHGTPHSVKITASNRKQPLCKTEEGIEVDLPWLRET